MKIKVTEQSPMLIAILNAVGGDGYPTGDEITTKEAIAMSVLEINDVQIELIKKKLEEDLPNLSDGVRACFAGHIAMITALHNLLEEWNIKVRSYGPRKWKECNTMRITIEFEEENNS